MTQTLTGLFELVALAGIACGAMVAIGSALLYPLLRRRLRRIAPSQRVTRLIA